MINLIKELQWRGFICQHTPEVENIKKPKVYIGFDPTHDSLHVGNLAAVMMAIHFIRYNIPTYILIGDATASVGDPSGKSKERNLLSTDNISYNKNCLIDQLTTIFKTIENNKVTFVNNKEWLDGMDVLHFLRNIGKHISLNYMLSKDSVKSRMENGISFAEFSYQLIQGYDFCYLYDKYNVNIQIGGSDQWGNMTTGLELIKKNNNKADAHVITTPLITKKNGLKFGKSENGNIWLNSSQTSPYAFYQFWLNIDDSDVYKFLRIFTLLSFDEIKQLEENNNIHLAKKELAKQVTTLIHGKVNYEDALHASEILFNKKSTFVELKELDSNLLLDVFKELPNRTISNQMFNTSLADMLVDAIIFSSKGDVNRMIKNGGLYINKIKITVENIKSINIELILDKYFIVQKGKKDYYIVNIH